MENRKVKAHSIESDQRKRETTEESVSEKRGCGL